MSTVGVKELKDRLTHYLRQTKRGEEVVVTETPRSGWAVASAGAETVALDRGRLHDYAGAIRCETNAAGGRRRR